MATNTTAIPPNTAFEGRSRSVRFVATCAAADFFKSDIARAMPTASCLRIRNNVYVAPTSIPPTAIGRTIE